MCYEVVILEAEGTGTVVMGNLHMEGPSGLADKEYGPHLEVGSLVGHGLNHSGTKEVDTDGSERLAVGTDSFLRQTTHSLGTEKGSLGSAGGTVASG